MKYWVQVKAPAGNWVDHLGTESLASALQMAVYKSKNGEASRVVIRKDKPIMRFAKGLEF